MFIITDKNNKIFHISETIGYQENGNVLVDNDTLAIAKPLVKRVYEVDTIPNEVCTAKYCYTEADGFYENPNYVEPLPSEQERLALLEEAVNSILGF